MDTLTHKTTLLLSPREHQTLKLIAKKEKTSLGELIRLALRKTYLMKAKKSKKSWDQLFKLKAPVGDLEEMESEILKGRF